MINADHIERIEAKPDTILSLISGRKIIVRESVKETIHRLIEYRRTLQALNDPITADMIRHDALPV